MPSSETVSVFSVATEGLSDPRVRNFSRSAAVFGVNATLLTGAGWQGYDGLALAYARAAEALPPARLAIMLDAPDLFVGATPAQILAAYARVVGGRRRAIVLGLETGCPPGRCTPVPDDGAAAAAAAPGIAGLRHINGGFVAGEAASVARMWRWVSSHACCAVKRGVNRTSGQLGIGRFARAHPHAVAYDREQRLVAHIINGGVRGDDGQMRDHIEWADHYEVVPRPTPARAGGLVMPTQVRNRHSGVAPCFVHAPGTHEINRKAFRKRRRIMEPWDAIVRAMAPDDDPCGGAHEVLNLIREPRPGEVVRLC